MKNKEHTKLGRYMNIGKIIILVAAALSMGRLAAAVPPPGVYAAVPDSLGTADQDTLRVRTDLVRIAKEESAAVEDTVPLAVAPAVAAVRDWRWQIHTNTLLPLLNGGVAYTAGPRGRLSFGLAAYWPWLRLIETPTWCIEALAATAEARWTFRDGTDARRRGTGPSLALVAAAGYYDLGIHAEGVQGEGAAAMVDAAWTWAVAKGRLRLGLHVAGGYAVTQYREYTVYDGRAYRDGAYARNVTYWGPLKAELRLSFPLWREKMEVTR